VLRESYLLLGRVTFGSEFLIDDRILSVCLWVGDKLSNSDDDFDSESRCCRGFVLIDPFEGSKLSLDVEFVKF